MKKLLPIIILLLFFQGVVYVNAIPAIREANHLYNFELMPVGNEKIEIDKEIFTFDLRETEKSFFPQAEVKAQYVILNQGEPQSVKLALPCLATYEEAMEFYLQNISVNNKYLESSFYVGDWNNSYQNFGFEENEIDFKEEFSEATSSDYSFPELSGYLYKFELPFGVNDLPLEVEFEPGTKFILEENQFSSFSNRLYLKLNPTSDSNDIYLYVIGEKSNLQIIIPEDSSGVRITDEALNFIDFYQIYLEEPDHLLKDLIIKHNLKKFLASERQAAICRWDLQAYNLKRLWFHVVEPELLGNNLENNLEFSYKITGHRDNRYSPPVFEFRYFLSSARYWKDYSRLIVRIYPNAEIKYHLKDYYDFTWKADGYYETEISSYPEEMLLLRFCEKSKPKVSTNPFYIVLYLFIIFFVLIPIFVFIMAGVILFVIERKKENRYKSGLK
ncbi:MAG TPA: hypothetical protein GX692_04760 [Acholeplasmataceae bacterium]|nr:hypothetical protein [Acholeplasmataceae bacterium]